MDNTKKFEQAVSCISPKIRSLLLSLSIEIKEQTQEVRLRGDRPIVIVGKYGTRFLSGLGRESLICTQSSLKISTAELIDTFNRICGYSVHSNQDSILNGYITIEGGHRAGICGTGVFENNKISAVRDVASINLRIAGEHFGAADEIICRLFSNGLKSVIIAGAPSTGKTTILRDMARQISGGSLANYYKTVIIDERREIAATKNGVPQNDVGINCDVLDMFPKGQGILTALRSMSPQIIICDEIGAMNDATAIDEGINSGVEFAVSVHASTFDEIVKRPQIKRLLDSGAFDYVVLLKSGSAPGTIQKIYEVGDLENEVCSNNVYYDFLHCNGKVFKPKIISKDKTP
ncbi:MAG: stage III sporulation protein AA [Oscillospiraceae bacterium]